MLPSVAEHKASTRANARQKEAIFHKYGPLLIIAGPGSGKTFTLVERIVHLILDGVAAEEIMVSTFTEKAAKELVTRVSSRLLELELRVNLNEMYIGTLHSIFLRMLEEHREYTRLKRSYRMLDSFDQNYFIFRNINEYLRIDDIELLLGDEKKKRWDKARNLVTWINKVAEECLDPQTLQGASDPGVRALGFAFERYLQLLEEENAFCESKA
ncbi:MAG: UvrD-helicase domain-containing protein [Bacteroidota bacterium]